MFGIDDLEDELLNQSTIPTSLNTSLAASSSRQSGATSLGAIDGVDKRRLTEEWARSQFASNEHPWSDADITPIMR